MLPRFVDTKSAFGDKATEVGACEGIVRSRVDGSPILSAMKRWIRP